MGKSLSINILLWIDAIAALLSGVVVFFLVTILTQFLNLPESLLTNMSMVSLIYASFSFYLALQKSNSKRMLSVLVVGNLAYAIACIFIMLFFYNTANMLGIIYLILESIFVGMLAFFEWRQVRLIMVMS